MYLCTLEIQVQCPINLISFLPAVKGERKSLGTHVIKVFSATSFRYCNVIVRLVLVWTFRLLAAIPHLFHTLPATLMPYWLAEWQEVWSRGLDFLLKVTSLFSLALVQHVCLCCLKGESCRADDSTFRLCNLKFVYCEMKTEGVNTKVTICDLHNSPSVHT